MKYKWTLNQPNDLGSILHPKKWRIFAGEAGKKAVAENDC